MRKHILCLSLAMMLLACGCGDDRVKPTDPTTTTASTTTTLISTSLPTSTTAASTTSLSTTQSDTTSLVTPSLPTSSNVATQSTTATTTTTTTNTASTVTAAKPTEPSVESITFKATVRDQSSRQPIGGITVTVYANDDTVPAGSGITGNDGVARIPLMKSTSYRVVLSNLPQGYEANAFYRYSTNTVNINITKAAIRNEADHSAAQYAIGKIMTDFTLTDTDGNTYRLSDLLKEKQLVVLDFWYTTCEPCKLEFPFFEAAVQKYGDSMSLLAIDPFDNNKSIIALRDQLNSASAAVSFPMFRDTCNLYLGFDVTSYPTTVFIDSNGCIMDIHVGAYASQTDFFAALERYVQQ